MTLEAIFSTSDRWNVVKQVGEASSMSPLLISMCTKNLNLFKGNVNNREIVENMINFINE